jgi:hypothetical protein
MKDSRIAAAIALVTIALFAPSIGHPFVMYDDPAYVTDNPQVLRGLTSDGIRWAFTEGAESNWHPITWISHMTDVSLFGVSPAPMRFVSVAFHAASSALLFLVLAAATGARGPSVFAAALFAIHPLRVESVVWISERKDVLCVFFSLLAVGAYVRYARIPSPARYALALAAFACALMSKPMAVTLPVLLLLMDVWPLARTARGLKALLLEKAPLAALSAACAVVTYLVQREGGAMSLLGEIPVAVRTANAVVSAATYLGDTVWPAGLTVIYPYPPGGPGALAVSIAALVLSAVTGAAIFLRRRVPALAWGWAWYLVALLPVLGFVQIGGQSHADRYTYLPGIGLAVAFAWTGAAVAERSPGALRAVVGTGAAALVALAAANIAQQRHWGSDLALFGRAVAVTRDNHVAHHNLSIALAREGRFEEAVPHHREAIRAGAAYGDAWKFHRALADSLVRLGRLEEAVEHYRASAELEPGEVRTWNDLAVTLGRLGDLDGAVATYERAVALHPGEETLRRNLEAAREIRVRERASR